MTATATRVLLTVEDVAAELSVTKLAVQRIIARGHLPATQVGAGVIPEDQAPEEVAEDAMRLRVSPDDLLAYTKAGAPDLKFPPVRSGWLFDQRLADASDRLAAALAEEIGASVPDADTLALELDEARSRLGLVRMRESGLLDSRKVPVTPGMRAILDAPSPVPGFKTWLQAAVTHRLREDAGLLIHESGRAIGLAALETFYRRPAAYEKYAQDSWDRLMQSDKPMGFIRRTLKDNTHLWFQVTARDLLDLPIPGAGAVAKEYMQLAF